MNIKKTVLVGALGLMTASGIQADSSLSDRLTIAPTGSGYHPSEMSLDLFGFYGSHNRGGGNEDAFGPGVGVNYFFTRNVGISLDSYADAFKVPYLLNASAIYRYPVGETGLAPYALAGFGRQWRYAAQWTGHIGGGLEYRLNSNTGIFSDFRRVFADVSKDYTVVRFGFRFSFR